MNRNQRFTKVELKNYLSTGDVDTPFSGTLDVAGFTSRSIDFAIQHNPTAVYGNIKKTYGNTAFPNYIKGLEFDKNTQESMSRFLHNKSDSLPDNAKLAFAQALLMATPSNPKINNWTVPQN
jgi:hypothetical protein